MLGMNCRNVDFINRYNQRRLYPLVDNKLKTKLPKVFHKRGQLKRVGSG